MRCMADVGEKLDAHSYPATTSELVEAYGDLELDAANGTETFGDLLRRLGEERFESAEEARMSAYQAVSQEAIGRKGYSDRDAPSVGETGHEHVSF